MGATWPRARLPGPAPAESLGAKGLPQQGQGNIASAPGLKCKARDRPTGRPEFPGVVGGEALGGPAGGGDLVSCPEPEPETPKQRTSGRSEGFSGQKASAHSSGNEREVTTGRSGERKTTPW